MNALQGIDRYRKEGIQVSTYKKWDKGSVSLQYQEGGMGYEKYLLQIFPLFVSLLLSIWSQK